ncbi:MAG: hypothetical protein PHF80_03615, partial [Methanothrix sp.]|nr:hypothetical protein [Methanothrix sp.]
MTYDCIVSSLSQLAMALSQPNGYDPGQLQSLARQQLGPVSSFAESILSSDEEQMQKSLTGLADHLSGLASYEAWFDLGRVASSLFFHHAALEYFEWSARVAEEHDRSYSRSRISFCAMVSKD